jgi:hypothetical protein
LRRHDAARALLDPESGQRLEPYAPPPGTDTAERLALLPEPVSPVGA